MPELPEVDTLRRSLRRKLVGRHITTVIVRRRDVVHGCVTPTALLRGCHVTRIDRHGKQLAICGSAQDGSKRFSNPCICIHLGMSGSMRLTPGDRSPDKASRIRRLTFAPHTHVVWRLDDGSTLAYHDPRRFGGVWTFPNIATLRKQRWHRLGPDALRVTPTQLHHALGRTSRPIKPALLDQTLVAGLGNIYVDELLFACGIHPLTISCSLGVNNIQLLIDHLRPLLRRAIRNGGSTLRDHADVNGQAGRFQQQHQVYGHAGQPCQACDRPLRSIIVSGRTTVYCESCQQTPSD